MAKFLSGPLAGVISGSQAGTTFSRNRYGAYTRTRAFPVNPSTTFQEAVRSYLSVLSQAWRNVTDANKKAWAIWALEHPVTDRLGQKQSLTGAAAYIQLNSRIMLAAGTVIAAPPAGSAPAPLTSITGTWDIGAGNFQVAYTATPLGAGLKLWIDGCLVDSAGIKYVKNLFKHLGLSSAAQASPQALDTLFSDRLGTLTVGQVAHVRVSVFDPATGLLSSPLTTSGVLTSTP